MPLADPVDQVPATSFFGGDLPRGDEVIATALPCCMGQRAARLAEVRWRGTHLALAESFSVAARRGWVLGRLRAGRRRWEDVVGLHAHSSLAPAASADGVV